MWRILVLLTGSLGLYIVCIVLVVLFGGMMIKEIDWSWQGVLFFSICGLVIYIMTRDPKKIREHRKEKKAIKELRKQFAIEKEQKRLRDMNHIRVVAAVIHDDKDRIFVTQRGYGDMKGKWEFPGGKIEPDETREEALKREIREELAAEITIERYLEKVEWDYPKFRLTMYCYLCRLDSGYTLKEHSAVRWLKRSERMSVDWLPADRALFLKTTF
jgi:8-oxo-dGTP diphosphatase